MFLLVPAHLGSPVKGRKTVVVVVVVFVVVVVVHFYKLCAIDFTETILNLKHA